MKLKELTKLLDDRSGAALRFMLPSGGFVPDHFHVTEVGRVQKNFIDCGGTRRESVSCLLQVWTANDVEHRLNAGRLADILRLAEGVLGYDDLPVEVEYGPEAACQYIIADVAMTSKSLMFMLDGRRTACLAPDKCGVTECKSSGCCC